MYNINTGQARTDLYGRDKGDAVWFDNQIAVKGLSEQNARDYADKQAKDLAKAIKREGLASATQIGIGKVKPSDLNYFIDKQKKLSDYLTSKITVNNELAISDEVEFNKMVAELEAEIAQSEGQAAILSNQLKEGDENKHTRSSLNALKRAYGEIQGQWGEVPILTDKVDLSNYTKSVLQPMVENIVKTQRRGVEEFTPQEVNELLANTFNSNSTIQNQVQDAFEDAFPNREYTKEEGLKFYQDTQGKMLNLKAYNYAPQANNYSWGGGYGNGLIYSTDEAPVVNNIKIKDAYGNITETITESPISASGISQPTKLVLSNSNNIIPISGGSFDEKLYELNNAEIGKPTSVWIYNKGYEEAGKDKKLLGGTMTIKGKPNKLGGTPVPYGASKENATLQAVTEVKIPKKTKTIVGADGQTYNSGTESITAWVPTREIINAYRKEDRGLAETTIKEVEGYNAKAKPQQKVAPKTIEKTPLTQPKTDIPVINSKSEFDSLPKGAKYKKADGKTYIKG